MKNNRQFDYIIIGAGCSGLSLALRMLAAPALHNKKILLVDKQQTAPVHKTWCFWDKGNIAAFWNKAAIIQKEWQSLWIKHPEGNIKPQLDNYRYKLIRSKAFFDYSSKTVKDSPNISLCYEAVEEINEQQGTIITSNNCYTANCIFSSVLLNKPVLRKSQVYLLQHFRGWWIETDDEVFDDTSADMMNFNTSQANGCAFFYVLPVSRKKALVEYTLFTAEELQEEEYAKGLKTFINDELKIAQYRIIDKEQGIIPMTDFQFPRQRGKVFFIGTAGGQTKASTGYTFSFIQKQAEFIVDALIKNESPALYKQPARFHFYDSVLLKILNENKEKGADIFFRMFRKNRGSVILKFLDNETNFAEELGIMNSTDKALFIPAAIKKLVGK